MTLRAGIVVASLIFLVYVEATPNEASALLQLKTKWEASSVKVRGWDESVDPCMQTWPGVVCAASKTEQNGSACEIADPNCFVVGLKLALEGLTGPIPSELTNLNNLEKLDLHGNNLVGEVSKNLRDFFARIIFLDLSANYINGTIPVAGALSAKWQQNCFVEENGCAMAADMRNFTFCNEQTLVKLQPCESWGQQRRTMLVMVSTIISVCLIAMVLLLYFFVLRARRQSMTEELPLATCDASSQYTECKHYTYNEMEAATYKFSEKRLLGSGGFGQVFKGQLGDGTCVAIKQLEKGSTQGDVEFWNEVLIIGTIKHPNVVTLRGYCKAALGSERILVYDYMPNGSVLDALLDETEGAFPWERRFRVALGAASGLEFLHEKCTPKIIHRDIKPSNILLDDMYNARVGDFGLAKVALTDQSHVTTIVVGTQGFLDPEYALTGKLTEKSDVFSFGMLLFVLISGRCTMETQASQRPSSRQRVSEWMQVLAKEGELSELVDPRLNGVYDRNQMSRCAQVAMMCTRIRAETRPSMGDVRRLLQGFSCQQPLSAVSSPAYSPSLLSLRQTYTAAAASPFTCTPSPQLQDSFNFSPPLYTQQRPAKSNCSPFSPDHSGYSPAAFSPRPPSFTPSPFSPMFTPHHNLAGRGNYTALSPQRDSLDADFHRADQFDGESASGRSDTDYLNNQPPYIIGR